MSLWEKNKARRRQQILDAAHELIAQGGMGGLSMRRLAEQAEVSIRTIYNLVGSQSDILEAIIKVPMQRLIDNVASIPPSAPLERLDTIVSGSVENFINDPQFYKSAWVAVNHLPEFDYQDWLKGQAVPLFKSNVEQAMNAGLLGTDISPGFIAEQIFYSTNKAFHDWAMGFSDEDAFRERAASALYICLLAVSTEQSRDQLLTRLCNIRSRVLASNKAHESGSTVNVGDANSPVKESEMASTPD